jgi:hypothetical protein
MKKYLFSIVVVALMAGTLMADWEFADKNAERKDESYNWPAEYIFQDICVIPVEMDIGFWVKIVKCQDKKIELQQTKIHEYSGCVDVEVQTNVNVEFQCSIAKVEQEGIGVKVPGDYSCSVNPSTVDAPGGTITICAKIVKADLTKLVGGTCNVHVANVTLKVRPRVTPKLCC